MSLNLTGIEWVKNPDGTQGFTSNPIKGYCPIACSYCYSRQDYDRFGWDKTIRFDGDEMLRLFSRKKPAGIFIGSMHEIFLDEYIKKGWTGDIVEYAKLRPQHRIYLLTKQPQNLPEFSPFPDNCWVGVTATNQETFYEATKSLADIEASVKYISVEPMLGRVFFPVWIGQVLDWLIIGAQTKPYKPPRVEDVKELVEHCFKAVIPVFLKDNLMPLAGKFGNKLARPLRVIASIDGKELPICEVGGAPWGRPGDFAIDEGGAKRFEIKEVLEWELRQEMPG